MSKRLGVVAKIAPTKMKKKPTEIALKSPSRYLGLWFSLPTSKIASAMWAYNISALIAKVHILYTNLSNSRGSNA